MLDFIYDNGTKIIFGVGKESETGALVREHSQRALLVYGGGSVVKSGLLDRVKASLTASGVYFEELGGVQPNPRLSLVYTGIELCRAKGLDFIMAVGGGSVIDTGKAIALGVPYSGDVWDFFTGRGYESSLPTGVVLTIPAAGSESSCDAVITKEEGFQKRACCSSQKLRPAFAILNPALTLTLPDAQTFAGVTDIMVHITERYFSNTKDVDVSDRLSEALLQTAIHAARKLVMDPQNLAARSEIMWCGTLAHNNLTGVDRESDWATHMMGHELSALYDATHGATLAVVLPAWMRYCYKANPGRMAQFANRVFGVPYVPGEEDEMALAGIDQMVAFLRRIGMPTTMVELGIQSPDIPTMAKKCTRDGARTIGNFKRLDINDVAAIFTMATLPVEKR